LNYQIVAMQPLFAFVVVHHKGQLDCSNIAAHQSLHASDVSWFGVPTCPLDSASGMIYTSGFFKPVHKRWRVIKRP